MPTLHRLTATMGGFILVTATLFLAACSTPEQDHEMPPAPVRFVTVEPADVTIEQEYAGRVRGSREVEIRSRVSGILLERLYDEGQMVAEGDDLFLIDPDSYEIAVSQAEAELDNANARLSQAEREWRRVSGLYERGAVSERERDDAKSNLQLAEAGIALARAGLASAQLNLGWTRVKAPISGATGLETESEGSLVDTGALLTTVTQTDPAHVRFALPENDAATQRRARRAMVGSNSNFEQTAQLILPDDSEYRLEGSVDFTDATIDPRTGSVNARAIFPNPDNELIPGQFVRIRMQTQSLENVFSIPRQAISQDGDGEVVFVVDDSNRASARHVDAGPVKGDRQIVLSGLEAGDRVVVTGLNGLRDGATVDPHPQDGGDSNQSDGR
ncbi:MAG TPA: efflux RND transporter periplasmic adaptor subunit [Wenzhouxiangella sp.]|nr:efflux RND transporter periplasmic adaptor subunit [Wenzhouxiangella sp.]